MLPAFPPCHVETTSARSWKGERRRGRKSIGRRILKKYSKSEFFRTRGLEKTARSGTFNSCSIVFHRDGWVVSMQVVPQSPINLCENFGGFQTSRYKSWRKREREGRRWFSTFGATTMKIPGEQREGSLEKIVSELVRHPWLAIRGAYSIEKTRVNRLPASISSFPRLRRVSAREFRI